jgi:hypothetical protein
MMSISGSSAKTIRSFVLINNIILADFMVLLDVRVVSKRFYFIYHRPEAVAIEI